MKHINIAYGPQDASAIIQGCMRMPALTTQEAADVIRTAYENGINFFDHATCYGEDGEAEKRFGDALALTGLKREDILLQSKCGLRFDRNEFDWSRENILTGVDGILRRLRVEYLDALLLHRPDVLFDPAEVAEAFDILAAAGKVRHFGVSNLVPMQIELLKKYVKQPLVINQVQLSLEQSQLIDQALYMNNKSTDFSINRDGNEGTALPSGLVRPLSCRRQISAVTEKTRRDYAKSRRCVILNTWRQLSALPGGLIPARSNKLTGMPACRSFVSVCSPAEETRMTVEGNRKPFGLLTLMMVFTSPVI